jgi:hypothetical protein
MTTTRTITLAQLDALCHALDDYLAVTLDDHYSHNSRMNTEFKSARDRLLSAYNPVEAKVWAIKTFEEIPVTIE